MRARPPWIICATALVLFVAMATAATADPVVGGSARLSLKVDGLEFTPTDPVLTLTGGDVDTSTMVGSATTTGKTTAAVKGRTIKLKFTQINFAGDGKGNLDVKVDGTKVAGCFAFSDGKVSGSDTDGSLSKAKLKLKRPCVDELEGLGAKDVEKGPAGKVVSVLFKVQPGP